MTARDRMVLIVVGAVAALAACWMFVIQPKRTEAGSLGSQVQTLRTQVDAARAQINAGLAARSEFDGDYTQLAQLGEALPLDDNVPSLIYQIQSAATATHVAFNNLQMQPGSGGSASAPVTTTSSSTPASPTTAASAPTLPPGAAMGPAGLPTEQFTFSFTGNFFHLSDFLQRLQRFVVISGNQISVSGRLLTINAISFGQGANKFPEITATVSATTYMAPPNGLLNGASAAGPAGTTATPSAPSTSGTTGATAAIATPIR